jgi:hypothetical protein
MVRLGNVTDDIHTSDLTARSQTPNCLIICAWDEQILEKECKIHNISAIISRELEVDAWNVGYLHSSKIVTQGCVVGRI